MKIKPNRVTATPAALDLVSRLQAEHGALLFHQSGGCCDGSSPMCFKPEYELPGDASPADICKRQ